MMADNRPQVHWTLKGPLLLAGVALLGIAWLLGTRKGWITGAVLAALGVAFIGYSMTIKDWCALRGTTYGQTAWGNGFGGGLGTCLKEKGLFSI